MDEVGKVELHVEYDDAVGWRWWWFRIVRCITKAAYGVEICIVVGPFWSHVFFLPWMLRLELNL